MLKPNMTAYIKQYLDISEEEMQKNADLLLDTLFYRQQATAQHNPDHFATYQMRTPLLETLSTRPPREFSYPDGKSYAICLTHDIDDIYPTWIHSITSVAYSLGRLDLQNMAEYLFWKYRGKDSSPFLNLQDIMELEAKYGAKSSFYFLTCGSDHKRFRYDIADIEDRIRDIADSGWEVGLHGGYYTYNNIRKMLQEKKRLEEVLGKRVIGYRNHYLRFQVPLTWELLAEAGFKYDTTFGFNAQVGFRNGLCHPFKPYHLEKDQEIELWELPLHIMDCTLMELAPSSTEAWEIALELLQITAKYRGVLTLLWHNNSFHYPLRRGYDILYEKILEYGEQTNAWMTSGEEIWRWWESGSCFN